MHGALISQSERLCLGFDHSRLVDENRLNRDIIVEAVTTGGDTLYLIHNISTLDDLAEDCVSPTLRSL